MDLFDVQSIPLELAENRVATVTFWPNWLDSATADELLDIAISKTPWRKDFIQIMGKKIAIPRLQNWFGTPGTSYTYSRIQMQAVKFPVWLDELRSGVELQTGSSFNRALVNYYRDGRDSVDWHADDEPELGSDPVIASVSVGAERVFKLRHQISKRKVNIELPHGSLLLMGPGIQEYWHHSIAKVKQLDAPRVNFTFRYMEPAIANVSRK